MQGHSLLYIGKLIQGRDFGYIADDRRAARLLAENILSANVKP